MSIAENPEKAFELEAGREALRALVRARGPACPDTRRRAAAVLSATLAAGVSLGALAPPAPAPSALKAPGRVLGALLVAGLLSFGACVPVEAIQHADEQARIAHDLSRAAPSEDGRQIGAMEEVAWRRQRISLTGDDVPQAAADLWAPLPVSGP